MSPTRAFISATRKAFASENHNHNLTEPVLGPSVDPSTLGTKEDHLCQTQTELLTQEGVTSTMHVISYKRIREFVGIHQDSKSSLAAWFKIVNKASWQNFAKLKQVYPSADLVGRYTVFNIAGNKYRLIARVVYRSQTLFIVAIMTHEVYDLGKWKE